MNKNLARRIQFRLRKGNSADKALSARSRPFGMQRQHLVGNKEKNGKWVDMIESGIIDPTKVTRNALMNASSISALFLTTEAGVAKIDKEEAAPAMPQGMY